MNLIPRFGVKNSLLQLVQELSDTVCINYSETTEHKVLPNSLPSGNGI
jgi:hypothetical protein